MKKIFILLSISFLFFNASSQMLGIYEFTGAGQCPNQNPTITSQPMNATFSDFLLLNVNCVSTADVYNTDGWNTTVMFTPDEYIQFSVMASNCFSLTLDSIIFSFRNSQSGNTPTWHLRSSLDNYANDIKTGISQSLVGMMETDTIVLDPNTFSNLNTVTFRFYLTDIGSPNATWRVDDVAIYGMTQATMPQNYFVDDDGDGFGTGMATILCSNPGGYSLNNQDCDDTDAGINPNTIWYADVDGDGYGDPDVSETTCSSSLTNPVMDNTDCNDNNVAINPDAIEIANNGTDEDCDGSDLTNGIASISASELKLFPNPGTNYVSIISPDSEDFRIQILDNQGKIILSDKLESNQFGVMEINTSKFARGSYQILIQNDTQIFRTSWLKI